MSEPLNSLLTVIEYVCIKQPYSGSLLNWSLGILWKTVVTCIVFFALWDQS